MNPIEQELVSLDEAKRRIKTIRTLEDYPPLGDTILGEKKSNVGIVFQHGFIGTNIENLYIANFLANAGYRILLPLLPGHGQNSDELRKYSWRDWLDKHGQAISYLQNEKSGRKIVLIGHSMGGTVSLINSARMQDIAAVVTLGSPVRFPLSLRIFINLLGRTGLRFNYHDFHFADLSLLENPLVKYIQNNYGRMYFKSTRDVLKICQLAYNSLLGIRCPILVVASKNDKTVPIYNASLILNGVSSTKKEYLELEQTGHVMVADLEKDTIAQAILAFLEKVSLLP